MGDSYSTEQPVPGEGLTVHQRYAPEHFANPSVAIKLENDRPVRVHVRLSVPGVDADAVQFHPEFESDGWSVDDSGLRFESAIPPESEVTTLYAIETEDEALFRRAIDSLVVDAVEPVTGDDVTGTVSGVDGDLTLEIADGATVGPDRPEESRPDRLDARTVTDGAGTTDPSRAEGQLTDRSTDELVAELADRMERESLTQSQRERLAALGSGADRSGPQGERIAHLQARVSDIETFTDAIADLSEEYGSPAAAFAAMEERLDTLEAFEDRLTAVEAAAGDLEATEERLDELDETVDSTVERLDSVEPRLDGVAEDVTAVEETVEEVTDEVETATAAVADLDETVETVASTMADVETAVEDLSGRTLALEGDLRAVEDWITGLENELEVLAQDHAEIEEAVETLADSVEGLDDLQVEIESAVEAVERDIDALASDQAALESDIEDIAAWREKVTGALEAFRGE